MTSPSSAFRVCVVGPLPPPPGGMANQCRQLVGLLQQEGLQVDVVRTNAPYRPAWVAKLPLLRAGFRLLPYLWNLWQALGRAQVLHVFANSGWSWHLVAAPALWMARRRGVPSIVNYRGGEAEAFLAQAPRQVLRQLRGAALLVTPSAFLQRVFAQHALKAEIIPNIIDLGRFTPAPRRDPGTTPRLLVARHLEAIYDNATAIRAMPMVRARFPGATLTVAGAGPERDALLALVQSLGLSDAVRFAGRVDNQDMPGLYAQADCVINSSLVDNMPISLLEAFACGLPVVSTRAGGIPDMVEHNVTGLLVPLGDPQALAQEVCRVLQDGALAGRLSAAAQQEARKYAWPSVRQGWLAAYQRAASVQGRA